jgi:hypothetical protein
VTKDMSHRVDMVLVPRATRNPFSTLWGDRIINHEKDHAMGFDSKGIEESPQGDLDELLLCPGVFAEESGEA